MSEPTGVPLPPLPRVSADELAGLIEANLAPESMVAFDADGTLWSGDIGMETFTVVLARRLLRAEASAALMREAVAFQLPQHAEPNQQAELLYRAFEEGHYPEDRAFAMMAWALAGYTTTELTELVAGIVVQAGLQARLLPEAVAVARRLIARRVPVFVVSASPTVVVEAAVVQIGLAVTRVFGMTAATRDQVVVPTLAATPTYGPGKAQTLRESCVGMRLDAAFGDSAFDLAMLCAARVPVAVRPKAALVARRGECAALVELASAEADEHAARAPR